MRKCYGKMTGNGPSGRTDSGRIFDQIRDTCVHRPESNVDELLRTAIEHRRLIRLHYRNKDRIIEPHDYGVHNGTVKLLAYQVGGSSNGSLLNWRWIDFGAWQE